MVQNRVYTEIRLRDKRSYRRYQNKKKRTEEQAQKRRHNRLAEQHVAWMVSVAEAVLKRPVIADFGLAASTCRYLLVLGDLE